MARRHSRSFVRPAPRTKIWIGAGVGSTSVAGSAKVLVSSLSAGALLLRPFTILRTRMVVQWESDQLTATETPQGDYGQIVVTDNAAAIGVTAVPDPSSTDGDPDADWYVHQSLMTTFSFASTIGINVFQHQYIIDSKAMRKVGANEDDIAVVSETGGVGAVIITRGRSLIQLH